MNGKIDYLTEVRLSLARAKALLEEEKRENLKYIALELRMCIEGIVYNDIQSYPKDCLPEEVFNSWQPDRVVTYIASVDPNYFDNGVLILAPKGHIIDTNGELRVDQLKDLGEGMPEEFRKFTQVNLKRKITKKMYHGLGSVLHVPTLKQHKSGVKHEKHRMLCENVASAVEERISANLGVFALWGNLSHKCIDCGMSNVFHVLKTIDPTEQLFDCVGSGCKAQYAAVASGKDTVDVRPWGQTYNCGVCGEWSVVWERELRLANKVECKTCGEEHVVGIGVVPSKNIKPKTDESADSVEN